MSGSSPPDDADTDAGLRQRLRTSLRTAMKERNSIAVDVLRSALAAIDNAEAVSGSPHDTPAPSGGAFAGTRQGAGAGDVARRELSEDDVVATVIAEIQDLRTQADEYSSLGQDERATLLRAQADLLGAYLTD